MSSRLLHVVRHDVFLFGAFNADGNCDVIEIILYL